MKGIVSEVEISATDQWVKKTGVLPTLLIKPAFLSRSSTKMDLIMNQIRIACVTSNYYLILALLCVSSKFKRESSYLPVVKLVFFGDYCAFKSRLNDNTCYNGIVIENTGNFFDLARLFESLSQQSSNNEIITHCAFLHDKKYLATLMNDTQDESIIFIDKDDDIASFGHQFFVFIKKIESALREGKFAERRNNFRCYDLYKRKLSMPELSTLQDIMQGFSLNDIALTRNRSVKTISSHKVNALRKLGVKSMSNLLVRR